MPELKQLSIQYPRTLKTIPLDITKQDSVDQALESAKPLLPNGLDILLNNAGKNPQPNTPFEKLYVLFILY